MTRHDLTPFAPWAAAVLQVAAFAGCVFPVDERFPCQTDEACPGGQGCVSGFCAASEECLPESDHHFCVRLQRECGTVTALDNCGQPRSAECGGCPAGWRCTSARLCERDYGASPDPCVPETEALCVREYADCGYVAAYDRCGTWRTAACGSCRAGWYCDADRYCRPLSSADACVPEGDQEWCRHRGLQCGQASGYDLCGAYRSVWCGSCAYGSSCDWNTNRCLSWWATDAEPYPSDCGCRGPDAGPSGWDAGCAAPDAAGWWGQGPDAG